ncbi:universal stress protein [Kitasatospora arboriphila]
MAGTRSTCWSRPPPGPSCWWSAPAGSAASPGWWWDRWGSPSPSRSEAPTVLVRSAGAQDGPHPEGTAVVVGVDTRSPSPEVLEFAFREAARRGLVLRAVHGWTPPPVWGYAGGVAPQVEADQFRAVEAELLDEALVGWREKYPEVTVLQDCRIAGGAQAVVDTAADAALVVVGRGAADTGSACTSARSPTPSCTTPRPRSPSSRTTDGTHRHGSVDAPARRPRRTAGARRRHRPPLRPCGMPGLRLPLHRRGRVLGRQPPGRAAGRVFKGVRMPHGARRSARPGCRHCADRG